MPVPDRTGLRSSCRVRAGATSAGTGYSVGFCSPLISGASEVKQGHVADAGRGQQPAELVGPPGPGQVDRRGQSGRRTGAGRVPQPAGIGAAVLGGGVGQAVPGGPRPLVDGVGVPQPQHPEGAVGGLGLHPGHRLAEVVEREVPASGQGGDGRRERPQDHHCGGHHRDQLAPSELGRPEVLLEGRHPEADGGGDGHGGRGQQDQRIDGQAAGPPPSDDPCHHPEDQGDGPEPPGPAEPVPAGQDQGGHGGHGEAEGQGGAADGPGGEPEEGGPRRRRRGRDGHPEHGDGTPSGPRHADHPGQADDRGHARRGQGQPEGPAGGGQVAEEGRGDHQRQGGQDHHDGRGRDEGDHHGLEEAEGDGAPGPGVAEGPRRQSAAGPSGRCVRRVGRHRSAEAALGERGAAPVARKSRTSTQGAPA